jgi:type VI secretion system secreted protein Hcp
MTPLYPTEKENLMRMKTVVLLSCCIFLGTPLAASAASDYFLTFDGVAGGSLDAKHAGAIDINSFSWDISVLLPSGGGAGGTGKPLLGDFRWVQNLDISTPTLFTDAVGGKHIKSAVLDLVKPGEKPFSYFTMTFDDVLLSSLNLSGDSGNVPTVQGSFTYSKLTMTVTPQQPGGKAGTPVTGGWDLKAGKAFSGSPLVLAQLANLDAPISAPVPEPGTWAMLLVGIGLVGARLRHRSGGRISR